MKKLNFKLLLLSCLLLLYANMAQGSCNASFTRSISGLTVSFTNTSTTTSGYPNMMTYYWSFGDGTYSSQKNPVKTYSSAGVKGVQLYINDSFGCTHMAIDTFVLVSSSGTCNASFTKSISGLNVNFTNTSTGSSGTAVLRYTWNFSDGSGSNSVNPVKTFATPGTKWARLTILDTLTLCSSTTIDTFVLSSGLPPCTASFNKSISGLTVTLTNTSVNSSGTGTGLNYIWNYSDGTTSTLVNPVKTFSSGGMKTIRLSISDSAKTCSASRTDTIYLTNPTGCSASFTKSISGLSVSFTNNSSGASGNATLVYSWNFSDGSGSSQRNPTKVFSSAGTKWARLTIYDTLTLCTASITDTFVLSSSATCSAGFTKSISGLNVAFTNTSTGSSGSGNLFYTWNFSDGTGSSLRNPTKLFGSAGTKWARLTIYDTLTLCTASKTDTFVLSSSSTCSASFTKTISGLNVAFNNTSTGSSGTGPLVYFWTFSDGSGSSLKNPSKVFASAGTKWAKLTIYDTLNICTSFTIDTFVLVGPSTGCSAAFSKTVSGLSVTLTNLSTNSLGGSTGLFYNWSFSDGTGSSLKNPVKTFSSAGLKVIQLSITDTAKACTATTFDSLILVAPTPLCSASFSLAMDTTTPFSFFLLNTSLVRPGCTYYWNFGDGGSSTSATPTHTYASFGLYYVCLTISDSVCTSTYCDSIGMDSTGQLLKKGGFSFRTLDFTKPAGGTGIENTLAPMAYHIYPNPSAGEVFIEINLKEATDLYIEITDLSGKVMSGKNLRAASGNFKESVDLSDLKPSLYFLNIRSASGVSSFKLIKN